MYRYRWIAPIKTFLILALLLLPVHGAAASMPIADQPLVRAQQEGPRLPLDQVDVITMPPMDNTSLMATEMARRGPGVAPHFAEPIAVELTPENSGTWETLADGTRLWRLRIQSPGAVSLNLGFSRYAMPPKGKLVLYAPDHSSQIGPFTDSDNEVHGQLWTPILHGDEVVVEVTLPADLVPALQLQIGSVNHGFTGFDKSLLSGSCNLDVICDAADGFPQVDAWRDQIRAVAVISTGGSTFCTGFLVNNTAWDERPYFMTADHCDIDASNAPSLVAYWNYENSWCRPPNSPASGDPGDGSLNQFNTGSIFRATYVPSDFTLVELDDPIDPAFRVYYAGWSAAPGNASSAVGIHHPSTDEKRISFEDQATTTTSYFGTSTPGDGTHIRVTDWDLGTTEPGSSGSPLFDPYGRVIGQLHGGDAACGNDLSDWYGRFSVSWTGGGSSATRLSNWLDSRGSGVQVLNGLDSGGGPGGSCPAGAALGALEPGGPTFNRPTNSGPSCSPSSVGTNVYYDVYSYYLNGPTPQDLFASLLGGASFDTVLVFYQAPDGSPLPFNPGDPCANNIGYNDDFYGLQSQLSVSGLAQGWVDVVVTSYANGTTGTYTMNISSPTCQGSLACNGREVRFENGLPGDWTVLQETGPVYWSTTDDLVACNNGVNNTPGSGFAACADSDELNPGGASYDTWLVTNPLDLTGLSAASLNFAAAYNDLGNADTFQVDISLDGGTTWLNLLSWNEDHYGPGEWVSLDLAPYLGQPSVLARFRYAGADWDWWVQLDDMSLNCTSLAPEISANPDSLNSIQVANRTTVQTLDIGNTGNTNLNWFMEEEPASEPSTASKSPVSPDPAQAREDVGAATPVPVETKPPESRPVPEWHGPEAVLYDNGPLINCPGCGHLGADASVLQSTGLGLSTFGFGHQVSYGYRIADDFVVSSSGWQIDTITFFAYQSASSTTSPITAVNLRIWDGPPDDPASSVVFGDTSTNRLISTSWANIYRVSDYDIGNISRPVMANTVNVGTFLSPGTYWLDWQADGALSYGPWAPPITINGQPSTGNALQFTGSWAPVTDSGPSTPQGFPFIIQGRSANMGCVLPSNVPWLSVSPTSGTTTPGNVSPVNVTFNSAGLANGIYNANLCVFSNDPVTPVEVVPTTLEVVQPIPGPLVAVGLLIDDDNSGNSSGNGDGIVDCGETIELYVEVQNQGPGTATGIYALLDTTDPYVTYPLFNIASVYPDIPEGAVQTNGDDWDFEVLPSTPNGHLIPFSMDITAANGGPWTDSFNIPVRCPQADIGVTPGSLATTQQPDQVLNRTLTIGNSGTANLNWNISEAPTACSSPADIPWLSASPTSGTTGSGGSTPVNVAFDSTGLSPGIYTGNLCVSSNDPTNPQITVPVQMTVTSANQPGLSIPDEVPGSPGVPVPVPVNFDGNGNDIASITFSVDYDHACLDFDPTDGDGDGIPDAVLPHLPPDFGLSVIFDPGDLDGELDILIADTFPPLVGLPNGMLLEIELTPTCTPPSGGTITAPVAFSSDPTASFGNTSGQSVPGTTADGSVLIQSGLRGDCNGDGLVDAGDISACVLEIFDGDGNLAVNAPGGTFPGSPIGCDSNADTLIDAGDISCTVLIIFNGPGACGSPIEAVPSQAVPTLSLLTDPAQETVGELKVPIHFNPGGHAISSLTFSLAFDPQQMAPDSTDHNGDGVPDAATLTVPSGFAASAVVDAKAGLVHVAILDTSAPLSALPEGVLAEIVFQMKEVVEPGKVGFAGDFSFGDIYGRSLPGLALD